MNQKTPYTPQPLDTTAVVLPDELVGLLERLAENTHDVWAAQRIKDGWTFGSKRDDANKKHPCLVPYAELPESEKEYDRKTAAETLKVIILTGYTVLETQPRRTEQRRSINEHLDIHHHPSRSSPSQD